MGRCLSHYGPTAASGRGTDHDNLPPILTGRATALFYARQARHASERDPISNLHVTMMDRWASPSRTSPTAPVKLGYLSDL